MELTPEAIAVIITSVLAAFGVGKGAEVLIARKLAARREALQAAELVDSSIDFITTTDCRDCRREIMEGIKGLQDSMKEFVASQTEAIGGLQTSVAVLGEQIEGQKAEVKAAILEEISSHERRFHSARTGTGNYDRPSR